MTNELIASRVFHVRLRGEGPTHAWELRIYKPQSRADGWVCAYELVGAPHGKPREIWGIDAVQALRGGLEVAKGELQGLAATYEIEFLGQRDLWL